MSSFWIKLVSTNEHNFEEATVTGSHIDLLLQLKRNPIKGGYGLGTIFQHYYLSLWLTDNAVEFHKYVYCGC